MKTDTEIIQERSQEYCKQIKIISEEDAKEKQKRQGLKLKNTLATGASNYATTVHDYIINNLESKSIEYILYHPDFSDQQKFDWFTNLYQFFKSHKIQCKITFF